MIDLFKGWPSADLLPTALLLDASERVLTTPALATPSLLYGDDPGYKPLRDAIATWLADYYSSPWTTAERICISGGASQNLACILQVFTDPLYTNKILMVAPTYHLVCRIFEDNGFAGDLEGVPEDEEGIDIQYLEERLASAVHQSEGVEQRVKVPLPNQKLYRNIIYAIPTFANPSGKCMSVRCRQQLVRLARKYDALIIADDVYDFLRWGDANDARAVLPRLVDIDHELDGGPTSEFGNVVSNGSFSKILGPGLRTGWAEGTPRFIQGLSSCGSTMSGGAPSQLMASIISETLLNSDLQRHLTQTLVPTLYKRYCAAVAALRKHLLTTGGELGSEDAEICVNGGYYIYYHLPSPLEAGSVAARLLEEENVIVNGGDIFKVSGDNRSFVYPQALRICFAWENESAIVEGIRALGRVVQKMLQEQKQTITSR